jgi:hypothetical protein
MLRTPLARRTLRLIDRAFTSGPGKGAAASGTPQPSPWQLHPSFPVDARLFVAGLAGAGALAYSTLSSGDVGAARRPTSPTTAAGGEEVSRVLEAETGGEEGLSDMPPAAPAEASKPQASKPQASITSKDQDAKENKKAVEKEPVYVDSGAVLSTIEDVLSKSGEEMLHETAGALAAASGSLKEDKMEKKSTREDETNQTAVRTAQAAMHAAVADAAGEAVTSAVTQALPDSKPRHAATHSAPPHVSVSSLAIPARDRKDHKKEESAVQRVLGIPPKALTAAGLIEAAAASDKGAGDNWTEFKHRHK